MSQRVWRTTKVSALCVFVLKVQLSHCTVATTQDFLQNVSLVVVTKWITVGKIDSILPKI